MTTTNNTRTSDDVGLAIALRVLSRFPRHLISLDRAISEARDCRLDDGPDAGADAWDRAVIHLARWSERQGLPTS